MLYYPLPVSYKSDANLKFILIDSDVLSWLATERSVGKFVDIYLRLRLDWQMEYTGSDKASGC